MKQGDYITKIDHREEPCKSCEYSIETKGTDYEGTLEIWLSCALYRCEAMYETCSGKDYKPKPPKGLARIINYIQNIFKK